MSQSPAGWFPQDDGRLRYWDGSAWTEHFAPSQGQQQAGPMTTSPRGGQPYAAPDAGAAPLQARAVRPWFRKKRVLIPVGLLVLILAVGAIGDGGESPLRLPRRRLRARSSSAQRRTTRLLPRQRTRRGPRRSDAAAAAKAKEAADAETARRRGSRRRRPPQAAKFRPKSYRAIAARDDPPAGRLPTTARGRSTSSYGRVTQFDSVTGRQYAGPTPPARSPRSGTTMTSTPS